MPPPLETLPAWLRSLVSDRQPSPGTLKVLGAVAGQPRSMSFASTGDVAATAEVNVATVVRAAQSLGYSGWPALRADLRSRYLSGLSASEVLSEHAMAAESPAWSTLRRDLQSLRELEQVLDSDQIDRVARHIQGAARTLVVGSGTFAAPGLQLAHAGSMMGRDIRLVREGGTTLVNAARQLRTDDCLVVYRLWKSPMEIMRVAEKSAAGGARIIIVSDHTVPGATGFAEEIILVPSESSSMFPSLVASVTITQAILANLIALDEPRARAMSDEAEAWWHDLDLFPAES